ncbi:hypothetical protein SERLA73DRAFT_187160 [Serpula lacrymans var. lacrymans S7.3]|uniref:Uncharacterized protein n=2 Tax=Serpula lacrymans var. lacrymans TaxID=341189 RepID=F8Q8K6_SERL3|nr:uncharacterized protein SERLADRAFT_476568 [Serpula lacrymans var. lacrymans S7.9]EGN95894.1 hypothetical protein SERLA73DRAFT_187160 [Serpula lacrymans var. lacrymans S7.3]EGO21408.1 hypothetical protein SERLADRAFT_476568 [Serpula lacrymans var. lacrymans S7.9]
MERLNCHWDIKTIMRARMRLTDGPEIWAVPSWHSSDSGSADTRSSSISPRYKNICTRVHS